MTHTDAPARAPISDGRSGPPHRWGHFAVLLVLTLLAAVPRLYGLGALGLTFNEDYVVLSARAILDGGVPRFPSGVLYPRALPFSYATAAVFAVLGDGELAARILPAAASIAIVGLGYAFARRLLGTAPALVTGIVLALSPWEILVGRTARMYSTLSLLSLVALYATFRVVFEGNTRWRAPAILAGVLACFTHQLGAVLVIPWVMLLGLRRGSAARGFVLASISIVGATALGVIAFERSVYSGFNERVALARTQDRLSAGFTPVDPVEDSETAEARRPAGTRAVPRPGGAVSVLVAGTALGAALTAWRLGQGAVFSLTVAIVALLAGFQYSMLAAYLAAAYLVFGLMAGRAPGWRKALALGAVLALGSAAWFLVGVAYGGSDRVAQVLRALIEVPPNFLEFYARLYPWMSITVAIGIAVILVGFARDRDAYAPHLFVAFAFVGPAVALGFHPDVESRFTERYVFHLNPYFTVLYSFAVWWLATKAAAAVSGFPRAAGTRKLATAAFAAVLLLVSGGLSPATSWTAMSPSYGYNPRLRSARGDAFFVADHKGSSGFVCEQAGPDDLVVPMDVLVHWAYCPRADYQLTSSRKGDAEGWIGIRSGESLETVADRLRSRESARVFVVLSGHEIGRKRRDPLLDAMLSFREWPCVSRAYEGRDGASDVFVLDRACLIEHLP